MIFWVEFTLNLLNFIYNVLSQKISTQRIIEVGLKLYFLGKYYHGMEWSYNMFDLGLNLILLVSNASFLYHVLALASFFSSYNIIYLSSTRMLLDLIYFIEII
jgi:hypothetical protein